MEKVVLQDKGVIADVMYFTKAIKERVLNGSMPDKLTLVQEGAYVSLLFESKEKDQIAIEFHGNDVVKVTKGENHSLFFDDNTALHYNTAIQYLQGEYAIPRLVKDWGSGIVEYALNEACTFRELGEAMWGISYKGSMKIFTDWTDKLDYIYHINPDVVPSGARKMLAQKGRI